MLLQFFLELIWVGPELSPELLNLKKIPFAIFWVCLKLCAVSSILSLSKNFTGLFCRTHPKGRGGTELSTELLDLKKKSLQNFLGMFKVL